MSGQSDPRSLDDRAVSGGTRSTGAEPAEPVMVSRLPVGPECLEVCKRELTRQVNECQQLPDNEAKLICMATALSEYARCHQECKARG